MINQLVPLTVETTNYLYKDLKELFNEIEQKELGIELYKHVPLIVIDVEIIPKHFLNLLLHDK